MRTKVQEGGVVSGRRGSTTSASFFKSSGGAKNSTIGEVSNIMSNIMSAVEHNGGTQEYMAPELCTSNRKFTKACDIYAVR